MNWILVLVFISLTSLSSSVPIPPTMNITGFGTSGPIAVQKRSVAVDNDNAESTFGRIFISQMLGSDSDFSNTGAFESSENVKLPEIIGGYMYEIFLQEDKEMMKRYKKVLQSKDLNEKLKVLAEVSERLESIVISSELAEALMQHPIFIKQHAKASLENVGNSGSAMETDKDPCNGPIPDIGKVNNLYGSESGKSMTQEMADGLNAAQQDPTINALRLAMIDYGFGGVPNPESREGAYYATRGYKSGTVGSAMHRTIGGMYLILGSVGEEKIGRIYNNQAVKALLNQPVAFAAIRCLAYIEQLYFTNVKKENPESVGAAVGAVVTPRTRDCLTQLFSGVFCSSA